MRSALTLDPIGPEDNIFTDWLALVCLRTNYKEGSGENSKITSQARYFSFLFIIEGRIFNCSFE